MAMMQQHAFRHRLVVKAAAGGNGASPAAAVAPVKRPAPQVAKQFTNINKFWVPAELQPMFVRNWRQRKAAMLRHNGFLDFELKQEGGDRFIVSSSWASIPEWEEWSLSDECRRSHLPWGIYQWVPDKGEGFPEDFVPFVAYDAPVKAQY